MTEDFTECRCACHTNSDLVHADEPCCSRCTYCGVGIVNGQMSSHIARKHPHVLREPTQAGEKGVKNPIRLASEERDLNREPPALF